MARGSGGSGCEAACGAEGRVGSPVPKMAPSGSETAQGTGGSRAFVSVSEPVGDMACSLPPKCCKDSARERLLRGDEGRSVRHHAESRAAKELGACCEDLLPFKFTWDETSVSGT